MAAWSPEWLRQHLRLPPPDTVVDEATVLEDTLAKLKEPTNSGFKYVYKSGERFQSKPYTRPGVQRSLGNFASAEEAAQEIVRLCYGCIPLPPSPSKDRAKRGEGPRPRIRRKGATPILSPCLLSLLSWLPINSCAQRAQICASAGKRWRRQPAGQLARGRALSLSHHLARSLGLPRRHLGSQQQQQQTFQWSLWRQWRPLPAHTRTWSLRPRNSARARSPIRYHIRIEDKWQCIL